MQTATQSPVRLSSCGEVERQCRVAQTLAQLVLPTTELECSDAKALEDEALEIERLRQEIFINDLDKCRSSARVVALSIALHKDPLLRMQEAEKATESEKQHFWNDVHSKIKRKDFSSFGFDEAEFDLVWNAEVSRRGCGMIGSVQKLQELEESHIVQLQQKIHEWSLQIAQSPFLAEAKECHALQGGSELPDVSVDALAMETGDDVWLAATIDWQSSVVKEHRDFILVVDLSGSMCDVIEMLKECLYDLVSRTANGDRISIVGFSTTPELLCDWTELATPEARAAVCDCIRGMAAHGGTRLVPAFDMVCAQLKSLHTLRISQERSSPSPQLQMQPCLRSRVNNNRVNMSATSAQEEAIQPSAMVILLSDGDPEEPVEAVSSAVRRALDASPGTAAALAALSLGKGSNPALMALTAQCGRGPSLYIANNDGLPAQMGRLWGHLDSLAPQSQTFLVLEPVDDAEVIETERPLGGAVDIGANGRQIVALDCGRPVAGVPLRLASRLRLPSWAKSGLSMLDLQRPLLRLTWLWKENDSLRTVSNELSVLQVPSLFIEAKLGLPIRVTVDDELANFDRRKFLDILAKALGVEPDRLEIGRLTSGSVIADLHLLSASAFEAQAVRDACARKPLSAPSAACIALASSGFPIKAFQAPGGEALKRVLQWQLGSALEAAGRGEEGATDALSSVQALAQKAMIQCLDPDPAGVAASVAFDASAAMTMLEANNIKSVTPDSMMTMTDEDRGKLHLLLQQAHAHHQQICPELEPDATAVQTYEREPLRVAAQEFATNAVLREESIPGMPTVEILESPEGTIRLRLHVSDEGSAAIVAFRIWSQAHEVQGPVDPIEMDWPVLAGQAADPAGVVVTLENLVPGSSCNVACAASNGRSTGPWSEALVCTAGCGTAEQPPSQTESDEVACKVEDVTIKLPKAKTQGALPTPSSRNSKRASQPKAAVMPPLPIICVQHAASSAKGVVDLSWTVSANQGMPKTATPGSLWTVLIWPTDGLSVQAPSKSVRSVDIRGQSLRVDKLPPAEVYGFRIEVARALDRRATVDTALPALSIQGTNVTKTKQPQPVEGLIVANKTSSSIVERLQSDPSLRPVGQLAFVQEQ